MVIALAASGCVEASDTVPSTTVATIAPPADPPPSTIAEESEVAWPAPRRGHQMTSDGAGRLIVFGGRSVSGGSHTYLADTWVYETAKGVWTEEDSSPAPSLRSQYAMTPTGTPGEIYLIGGYVGDRFTYPDAWYYSNGVWTRSDPAGGPTPRAGSAATWDEESGTIVLFGGAEQPRVAELPTNDTWVLDPTTQTWTDQSPSEPPRPKSEGHPTLFELALVYDSESDRSILLIGGDETWAYDTNTNLWEERSAPELEADFMVAAAYHAGLDRVVAYGGGPTSLTAETWLYDENTDTWAQLETATSPGPLGDHAMAYDATTDRVYLFGGAEDLLPLDGVGDVSDALWVFDGRDWDRIKP